MAIPKEVQFKRISDRIKKFMDDCFFGYLQIHMQNGNITHTKYGGTDILAQEGDDVYWVAQGEWELKELQAENKRLKQELNKKKNSQKTGNRNR